MNRSRDVCLVLLFPDESAIRWMDAPPKPGRRVRSPSGREYTVDLVLPSGTNTFTVSFVGEPQGRVRELASDLLERARKAASPEEIRRKRRYRRFNP